MSFRSTLRESKPIWVFAVTMIVGGLILRNSWMQDVPLKRYTAFLTSLSGFVIHSLGLEVISRGQVLGSPATSFSMRIANECNGLWAHLILLATILAYPARWKERCLGLALGQSALFLINIVRIVSLFVLGVFLPFLFRAAHVYIWQFLIIGFAFLLFFVWVEKGVRTTT